MTPSPSAASAASELRGRPVLVTGGAGFIGSHLVDALVGLGAQVLILDNGSTGRWPNLDGVQGRVEILDADIRDLAACHRACRGIAIVFHQAALGSVPRSIEDPVTTLAVNVQGSANVFDAARRAGVLRVVYASSSSVYGDSESLPRREGEEGSPMSPYAASKQMTEQVASVFATTYSLVAVGLRYFNVFGPRQSADGPYAAVVPRFFHEILAGRPPLIHGDGTQTRDFTFVQDAVRANLLAAAAPAGDVSGRAFNVASGRSTAITALASSIQELVGSDVEPKLGPARPGDAPHSLGDLSRVARTLGYQPGTSLMEGLEKCHQQYAATTSGASGGP